MNKRGQNLIPSHEQRIARQLQKLEAVLRFLRQHLWSTQDILQQVLEVSSRQAAHKALTNIEKMGYVRRYTYDALGGNITVWGITHQGQAQAFNVDTETIVSAYFEPSRISEQTIRHQLDIQRLRLKAEALGWHGWMDGDRLGITDKNQKRPDAVGQDAFNNVVAIECERTFKSLKRYEQILVNYLQLIKAGNISSVVWVSPTLDMAQRLQSIIKSIKHVTVAGQKVQINPIKHHVNLHFCCYSDWPNYQ